MSKVSARKQNIDCLRILSSVMVILLHATAAGSIHPGESVFLPNVVFNAISRFSVPCFLMISGYFMLKKEESCCYFFKKSAKLIITMMLWSALYLFAYVISGYHTVSSVTDIIRYLVTEPMHLWYFYALAVLTLFTPMLRVFAENCNQSTYRYTLLLMFFFGSIFSMLIREEAFPTLMLIAEKLKIGTLLTFPAYYLFGYYVKRFGISQKSSVIAIAIGAVLTVFAVLMLSFQKGILSENVISFFSLNVAVMSMGIFGFTANRTIRENALLTKIAPLTAGIYGIHMLILPIVEKLSSVIPWEIFRILFCTLMTFTLSAVIVWGFLAIKKLIFKKDTK